jgi:hypothetical protein
MSPGNAGFPPAFRLFQRPGPSNIVFWAQTEFGRFKHCFLASNNVWAAQIVYWVFQTMFQAKKQCLKPKNNEKTPRALFAASAARSRAPEPGLGPQGRNEGISS